MDLQTRLKAGRPILVALMLAIFLRAWAVSLLPQDFDEPVYLQNGFDYAALIRSGNVNGVIDYPQTSEHPAFVKVLYAGGILLLGKAATWTNAFYLSRSFSAFFGVLAVAFLAIALDPLAAGMLALHTLAVKYSSQVYLEAVPMALSLGAILCFLRVKRDQMNRWLWLSATALGIASASKYSYTPVAVVVVAYLVLFEKKITWRQLIAYSMLLVATFFICNVSLWHDPVNRLAHSLVFHVQYSQSAHVQEVSYPWYQPFIWIFTSAPVSWHPNVFFYFGFDGVISILAVLGLPREWKQRRWLVVWFAAGLIFLLLWPTKWPQYALILTPALCLMGAASLRQGWQWVRSQESYWDYLHNLLPAPTKWFWWAVGAFAFFIAAVYLSAAVKLAVGKIGWAHITAQNSFLPSNSINTLLALPNGDMLIGTDKGAALYTPPRTTEEPGHWLIFDRTNSGLSDNRVLSLARDDGGNLWFGTAAGLDRFDGKKWTTFQSQDLGLADQQVYALCVDDSGRVIAGTQSGATLWDGHKWTPLTPPNKPQPVFVITATINSIWIGTQTGVSELPLAGGEGTVSFYPTQSTVKDLTISADGTLWAATSGSGLAKFQNGNWTYFTTANSGLPLNLVDWVDEVKPGLLWMGVSFASNVGGELASFDGKSWAVLTTENSGLSGSEPRAIAETANQEVWIGTTGQGIDLYKLGR